ncbi:MAG: winged helix-turn-helix transcriptional regulator [Beijerinckiaceae bacterium]|nr:winged helix-turn-helix transcriptional regulator [Beijerinckiaceae bacterium]
MSLEKITHPLEPARKRSYDDACAAAHALDLVGERWALLVMRELMLGPKRFTDLRATLPGISANVLTQRLEGLEAAGIAVRRELPPPAASRVYELTDWGYEAEPIFQALGRWAARSPLHDPTLAFSTNSLILSLRTMFCAENAKSFSARIGLRIGFESFQAVVDNGVMTITRGRNDDDEAILQGDARSIAAVIYGGVPLEALEAAGAVKASGDRSILTRFFSLFPLPPKALAPDGAAS